jgi:hypothetical protein
VGIVCVLEGDILVCLLLAGDAWRLLTCAWCFDTFNSWYFDDFAGELQFRQIENWSFLAAKFTTDEAMSTFANAAFHVPLK